MDYLLLLLRESNVFPTPDGLLFSETLNLKWLTRVTNLKWWTTEGTGRWVVATRQDVVATREDVVVIRDSHRGKLLFVVCIVICLFSGMFDKPTIKFLKHSGDQIRKF